jgi:hypothetical protein
VSARLIVDNVLGDDHALDFGRALVDLCGPNVTKETFDGRPAAVAG